MAKRYMTVSEFAEKPGVLYQSAVSWARRGHIPPSEMTPAESNRSGGEDGQGEMELT
jgi:hypothetical protein